MVIYTYFAISFYQHYVVINRPPLQPNSSTNILTVKTEGLRFSQRGTEQVGAQCLAQGHLDRTGNMTLQ